MAHSRTGLNGRVSRESFIWPVCFAASPGGSLDAFGEDVSLSLHMPEPLTSENCKIGQRVRVIGAPERQGSVMTLPKEIEGRVSVRVDFDNGVRRTMRLD